MSDADISSSNSSRKKEVEVVGDLNYEKVYVAVGKELKACKSTLLWALQNSGAKTVCLIHVHQPVQFISILGGRFPVSSVSEKEVKALRVKEKKDMTKVLDDYLHICAKAGVQAQKLHIEMDNVENGVVELITQHKITRLVMGAAADNRYSWKMMEPKSKKAIYVRQHAPDFCHIWFICKGRLIFTRQGSKQSHLDQENGNGLPKLEPRLTRSTSGWSSPRSRADSSRSFDDLDQSSTFSLSNLSCFSRYFTADSTSESIVKTEDRELLHLLSLPPRSKEKHCRSPSLNGLEEHMNDQLDKALEEAEIARREAFGESMKRIKAEEEAIEAIHKAKVAEDLYLDELKRREELEKQLAKATEELESAKKQRDMALEELRVAADQKQLLETQIQKCDTMETELEDKIKSALDLLQNYKKL